MKQILEPDRLLSSAKAAELLCVSQAWLARHRWANTGPNYIRVGGPRGRAVRYRLEDLHSWIQQNRMPAVASIEARGGTR